MSLAQMKLWRGRSIQARLDVAYESFSTCAMNGKAANIKSFELGRFNVPGPKLPVDHRIVANVFLMCSIAHEQYLCGSFRLRDYPQSVSKAYDVGLLCKCLGEFVHGSDTRRLVSWLRRDSRLRLLHCSSIHDIYIYTGVFSKYVPRLSATRSLWSLAMDVGCSKQLVQVDLP